MARIWRTLAWSTTLAYSLVGFGTSADVVLCLGGDGHVAIELGRDGACVASDHHDEESTQCEMTVAPHCHCGPCLDIPLSLELGERKTERSQISTGPLKLGIPRSTAAFSPMSCQWSTVDTLPIPPPDLKQTLLSHRTVVLII